MAERVKILLSEEEVNKRISEIDLGENKLIVMISRNSKTIIPKGGTIILEGDTLVIFKK